MADKGQEFVSVIGKLAGLKEKKPEKMEDDDWKEKQTLATQQYGCV
jgi:hypothetical protein